MVDISSLFRDEDKDEEGNTIERARRVVCYQQTGSKENTALLAGCRHDGGAVFEGVGSQHVYANSGGEYRQINYEIRDTCKMAVNSYVSGMSSTRLDDLFVERLLTTLRLYQLTEQQTQRAFPSLALRPALSYELTQMDVETEGTPITAGEGLKEGDDLDQEIARLEQRRTECDARKEAEKRLQADMGRAAQDCREAT